MEFLPNRFDVLTNEQMKTFDGNPLEHTPASNHTDHAIWGYEYGIHFLDQKSEPISTLAANVKPPFTLTGGYQFVNLFFWWDAPMAHLDDVRLQAYLGRFRDLGWKGISLDYWLNLDSPHSNELLFWSWGWHTNWIETAKDDELRRILTAAAEVGLDTEVRMQMHVSGVYKATHADCGTGCRSLLEPTDIDLFFTNYTEKCLVVADILEETGGDIFTVFVEADSLGRYGELTRSLLDAISERFSGRLAIDQSTHHYLRGRSPNDEELHSPEEIMGLSTFWDWESASGTGVDVQMNTVDPICSADADQSLSDMASTFFQDWIPAVQYYNVKYPENRIAFGEVAITSYDEAARLGWEVIANDTPEDWQEGVDLVAAICIAVEAFGLEGMSFEYMDLLWETLHAPERHWHMAPIASPIHRTLAALLGGEYSP